MLHRIISKPKHLLILILLLTSFFHLFRLDYPNAYIFDEVYHGFTAKEYLKGSKAAWEWWTTPPPGVAYEWTHPPLAKEIMTFSMYILQNTDAWAWRLPGALLGILSVYLIYLIAKKLFQSELTALISAFLFSIDGLNFVQSRTGMNDIYLITFILSSLYFLITRRYFLSAVFLGLALASKWTAIYFFPIPFLILFLDYFSKKITLTKILIAIVYLFSIPPLIYLLSYVPFFLLGHDWSQFIELHRQMIYYHTHLKATHDYSSPWWSWPLNLYPVWYYVQYFPNNVMANIFTSGNPLLFWMGTGAILVTIWDYLVGIFKDTYDKHIFIWFKHLWINFINPSSTPLLILLAGFFIFWLPWALSPRIMFIYHFSPSVPFLCLALGYQIATLFNQPNSKVIILTILGLIFLSFLIVYPILTGIPLPKEFSLIFFRINATKNPFGG